MTTFGDMFAEICDAVSALEDRAAAQETQGDHTAAISTRLSQIAVTLLWIASPGWRAVETTTLVWPVDDVEDSERAVDAVRSMEADGWRVRHMAATGGSLVVVLEREAP